MTLSAMPSDGIYVILVNLAQKQTIADHIKFSGNRYHLFVYEVLESFGIKKLPPGERVWIKKNDQKECRTEPYDMTARMIWTELDKSVIVLSAENPPQSVLINNNAYTPVEIKTFEQNLDEQVKLWKAKKEKKEERPYRLPKAIESRNQAKLIVIRKKRKLRREAELQKNTDDATENKKDPGD